ncbi:MAG TPA: hypothetical protein VN366_03595 [Feifaniaceae bacterium]|nr:hypothetical protein [Feifaniaceae bacterium]
MNITDFLKTMFFVNPAQSGLQRQADEPDLPPIGEMMARLLPLSEEDWTLYAFSREPLRGRFTREQRLNMAEASRDCAQESFDALCREHGQAGPNALAKALGVEIKRLARSGGGSHVLFAQYAPPAAVTIFTDCLERAQTSLRECGELVPCTADFIEDVLLAHELFHHVEHLSDTIYTKSHREELWELGPIKNRSPVACLSEIAGMHFAKLLADPPFYPYMLDVLLAYGYSHTAAARLYCSILEAVQL